MTIKSGLRLFLATFLLASFGASAADEKKPQATMSEDTYNRLTIIQDLMEEKQYDNARNRLNNLLPSVQSSPYEYAVALQTYGYLYIHLEDWRNAGRYLKQALDTNALPDQVEQQIIYTLAQIYNTLEMYDQTIALMLDWLKTAENPPPNAYMLLANAYVAKEQFAPALPHAKRAIELAEKPREDWYRMYLAINYQLKRYPDAANILEAMVAYWPEKDRYWKELSTIYLQLKKDDKALAALAIIYRRGMLEDGRDLLNLARLYMLREAPYEAGKVIEKGMNDGLIEKNLKNTEVLAQAWLNARQNDKAVVALGAAGALSENGELYIRQAQIYLAQAEWSNAVRAAQNAIEKGGLKKPGKAYILLGSAAAESKSYDVALRAFRQARTYPDTRNSANQWLEYINQITSTS